MLLLCNFRLELLVLHLQLFFGESLNMHFAFWRSNRHNLFFRIRQSLGIFTRLYLTKLLQYIIVGRVGRVPS